MPDSELGWRKTWEEQEKEDYVYCGSDGRMIGRVYIHDRGGIINGRWRWFFSNLTGDTESRREAMLAVEEAYEKSRESKA